MRMSSFAALVTVMSSSMAPASAADLIWRLPAVPQNGQAQEQVLGRYPFDHQWKVCSDESSPQTIIVRVIAAAEVRIDLNRGSCMVVAGPQIRVVNLNPEPASGTFEDLACVTCLPK
jgi:hypothetical protein